MPAFYSFFIPATKPLRSQISSGFIAVISFRKHLTFLTVLQIPFPEDEREYRYSAAPLCTVILNCNKLDPSTHFPALDKHPA